MLGSSTHCKSLSHVVIHCIVFTPHEELFTLIPYCVYHTYCKCIIFSVYDIWRFFIIFCSLAWIWFWGWFVSTYPTFINAHLAVYLIWQRDSTAKMLKKYIIKCNKFTVYCDSTHAIFWTKNYEYFDFLGMAKQYLVLHTFITNHI